MVINNTEMSVIDPVFNFTEISQWTLQCIIKMYYQCEKVGEK